MPPALFKVAAAILSTVGVVLPAAARKAELARIGHYYATESMLVWDNDTGQYDAEATPATGNLTLRQHYEKAIATGAGANDLGEHRLF